MTIEATNNEQDKQPEPGSNAADAKPKCTVKRKGLWLAVPKEYEDTVAEDGEICRTPTLYELYECSTKTEVGQVLSKLKDVDHAHVKLFRADPIPLRLSTQVTITF